MVNQQQSPDYWGIDNDYGVLRDVLLGKPDYFKWKVLSMAGSVKLNQDLRDHGYEVYAPDMSMFTLGGGGVHCHCQALKRDPVQV